MSVEAPSTVDAAVEAMVEAFSIAAEALGDVLRLLAAERRVEVPPAPVPAASAAELVLATREGWALVDVVHRACASGLVRRMFEASGLRWVDHRRLSGLPVPTLMHYADGSRVPRRPRAVEFAGYLRQLAEGLDRSVFDGEPQDVVDALAPS